MNLPLPNAIAAQDLIRDEAAHLHRTLRRRIYVVLAICALIAFSVAATVSIYTARQSNEAQRTELLTHASNLAQILDREAESARALLHGLSSSPLLANGDLEGFYAQLVSTPRPKGVELVLSDTQRQLLNTRLPYGAALPRLDVYKPQPNFFETLQSDGYYVSGVIYGPVLGITASTVTIALPDDAGPLRYVLTSVLTSERLLTALQSLNVPTQLRVTVVDYDNVLLTGDRDLYEALHLPTPVSGSWSASGTPENPIWHMRDAAGNGYYVTRAKASLADWTAYVAMPDTVFRQAAQRTWILLGAGVVLLGFVGGALYRMLHRRLEAPIETMETMVREAKDAIALLNADMNAIRKTEHKRIAQELHDTTAQHLVAADLFLNAMKRSGAGPQPPLLLELEGLIKQALRELRSFSFLLRPMSDSDGTLSDTLKGLYEGYCARADLRCHIDIDPATETLPSPMRETLFKVAREALTNVHRHARASTVWLRIVIDASGGCAMSIRDDGVGGARLPGPDQPARGLGLQGFQEAAHRFGGTVKLSESEAGTFLELWLPKPEAVAQESALQTS